MYVPVCLNRHAPQSSGCGMRVQVRFIDTLYVRYAIVSIHAEKTVYGIRSPSSLVREGEGMYGETKVQNLPHKYEYPVSLLGQSNLCDPHAKPPKSALEIFRVPCIVA